MNRYRLPTIFNEALRHFPLPSAALIRVVENTSDIYGTECKFDFGILRGIPVVAEGWIEIMRDDSHVGLSISGVFFGHQKRSWRNLRISSEKLVIHANYDIPRKKWAFEILS